MKIIAYALALGGVLHGLPAMAQETDGCPTGSYSVVLAPDGSTLSIMFDRMNVERIGGQSSAARKVCNISAPLNLPPNQSLGVYKVDYRGFAKLAARQEGQLEVQYFLGPRSKQNGRVFKRKIKGAHDGDYLFTETLGGGQMKRVGCGSEAVLNARISLQLEGSGSTEATMAALDTSDGARKGGMVYHLDMKPCKGGGT